MPKFQVINNIWDDFNDIVNWTPVRGTWDAVSGWANQTSPVLLQENFLVYSGTTTFPNDYTVETVINFPVSTPASYHNAGILLRSNGQPDNRYDYEIVLMPTENADALAGYVGLYQHTADTFTTLATAPVSGGINIGASYRLKVNIKDEGAGVRFKIYVNDILIIDFLEAVKSQVLGTVVLYTYSGQARFSYIHQWSFLSQPATLPFHDSFPLVDPTVWQAELGNWNY